MIGEKRLVFQPCGPELAVAPRWPARGLHHLDLGIVQAARRVVVYGTGVSHGPERLAEHGRERDPFLDRRDHLEFGAVEVDDQWDLRPAAAGVDEMIGTFPAGWRRTPRPAPRSWTEVTHDEGRSAAR